MSYHKSYKRRGLGETEVVDHRTPKTPEQLAAAQAALAAASGIQASSSGGTYVAPDAWYNKGKQCLVDVLGNCTSTIPPMFNTTVTTYPFPWATTGKWFLTCGPGSCPAGFPGECAPANTFFPQEPRCNWVNGMPLPPGAVVDKTPEGWNRIVVTAPPAAIREWQIVMQKAVGTTCSGNSTCAQDVDNIRQGIKEFQIIQNFQQSRWTRRVENANQLPIDHLPPMIDGGGRMFARDKADGRGGWYVADKWMFFYGESTGGKLIIINIPYWLTDGTIIDDIFGMFDPLKGFAAAFQMATTGQPIPGAVDPGLPLLTQAKSLPWGTIALAGGGLLAVGLLAMLWSGE